MDFETLDQKLRNQEVLTDNEKAFLAAEYQKKIQEARMRCVNLRFHIRAATGN